MMLLPFAQGMLSARLFSHATMEHRPLRKRLALHLDCPVRSQRRRQPEWSIVPGRCRPDIMGRQGVRPERVEAVMATGWAGDGAVQDQIDATVKDAIERARGKLSQGPGRTHCEECGAAIPAARRQAVQGVRYCLACQEMHDREQASVSGYNRRGSKDSQLR